MKTSSRNLSCLIVVLQFACLAVYPADPPATKQFTIVKDLWRTPAKSQGSSNTCWCFSTTSFLESEAHRRGRGDFELSQMFTVYQAYQEKALRYLRRQGKDQFGMGGLAHDVLHLIRKHGTVPRSDYLGLPPGAADYDQRELFRGLTGILDGLVKGKTLDMRWQGDRLESKWGQAFRGMLEVYLGKPPCEVHYQGKTLSPQQFANEVLAIPYEDYVEVTSYPQWPFYQQGELLLADNWLHYDRYYNVPLDEFVQIIDYALGNGFSLVFDLNLIPGAYSDKKGYGSLPADEDGSVISQDVRNTWLESWATYDDHLEHAIGTARDEQGKKFYLLKDSVNISDKPFQYISENYVRGKVLFFMVHKDGLPPAIRQKLGL
jgi:bleomycin hydrolase